MKVLREDMTCFFPYVVKMFNWAAARDEKCEISELLHQKALIVHNMMHENTSLFQQLLNCRLDYEKKSVRSPVMSYS